MYLLNINKVCGLLGLCQKAGKIVFGTEASIEAINRNKVKLVLIATNASDRMKKNFYNNCKNKGINIYEVLSIEEMSRAIGQNNKAVICIKDINFSKAITKIIDGGEVIG